MTRAPEESSPADAAKIILLFLAAFVVPVLLVTYMGMVVFGYGCDPKFGCALSFELISRFLTLPAAILLSISAAIGVWRFRPRFQAVRAGAMLFGILSAPFILLASLTGSLHGFAPTVLALCYFLVGPFMLCRLCGQR